MTAQERLREQICGEAADWFVRQQEESVSGAQREEFAQWLLRSPVHLEEYLAIARSWGDVAADDADLQQLIHRARTDREAPNVVALSPGSSSWPPPSRRGLGFLSTRHAVAAGLALAAVVAGLWALRWENSPDIATAIGEQRSFTLADGSIVHLNTDSQLRIELSEHARHLILGRGEARFVVAKDTQRPFLVTTSQATVRALGTIFNVQTSPERTAVTVIEGRIALSGQEPQRDHVGPSILRPLELHPGQHAAITAKGEVLENSGPSVERALAWSDRRLIFHEEPLSSVVAEFNRYHVHPMRIEDPLLAATKISGAFDANDSASLVDYLQQYEQVIAQTAPDGGRLLKRR